MCSDGYIQGAGAERDDERGEEDCHVALELTDEVMPVLDALGFLAGKTPVTVVVSSKQFAMDLSVKKEEQ